MEEILNKHNIGAYITKTGDEHLSEYIGESDERVKFLTGFTGSNGLAITCSNNSMYTDSRYFLQAEKELVNYKHIKHSETSLETFLDKTLSVRRVGVCSKLIGFKLYESLKDKLNKKNIELVLFEDDLVDSIWINKPKRNFNEVYSIENENLIDFYKKNLSSVNLDKFFLENLSLDENTKIVSLTYQEKLCKVREMINNDETLIISELDTIARLFNLRGSDIKYNPVFYSYVILTKEDCKLFTNSTVKLKGLRIEKYESFYEHIKTITGKIVFSGSVNAFIGEQFTNSRTIEDIRKLQSIKGRSELEGFNLAYILDGIALTKLFDFIEKNYNDLDEKAIEKKLNDIKSNFSGYKGPSFASIVGSGSNSAIVHYEAGNKSIDNNAPILIDSGSNYIFGTTDTTRSLFIGSPTSEYRKNFTRVLKGQLRAMFGTYPVGVSGNIVDALTRLDLWSIKEDYGHAFGHGVGHFLCVHENPPTLSPNYISKVEPNQVFSLEPGYYDSYGIRIENLVVSCDIGDNFMRFKNITYVPYQLNLIDIDLLSDSEIDQLNELSRQIRSTLEDFLIDSDSYEYLIKNTEPLKR